MTYIETSELLDMFWSCFKSFQYLATTIAIGPTAWYILECRQSRRRIFNVPVHVANLVVYAQF